MRYDALVPGGCIDVRHHACILVAHQIGSIGNLDTALFQLCGIRSTEIMTGVTMPDAQFLERLTI